MAYSVNMHFQLLSDALEKLGDAVLNVPAPPSELGFIPERGDIIRLPGIKSFQLVVVAREISFEVGALEINIYVDTLGQDYKLPELYSVK